MNSKKIKFDKAPQICNSNHQAVPINMILHSNKKTPICLTRNYIFWVSDKILIDWSKIYLRSFGRIETYLENS